MSWFRRVRGVFGALDASVAVGALRVARRGTTPELAAPAKMAEIGARL